MRFYTCLLISLMLPRPTHNHPGTLLIFWNVGQGSWATISEPHVCWHFDMGGETSPSTTKLFNHCRQKINILILSHNDRDHTRFIKKYQKTLHLCKTQNLMNSLFKAIKKLPHCDPIQKLSVQRIHKSYAIETNDSDVFLWSESVLFPGDLPRNKEQKLLSPLLKKIKIIAVGHHGSLTSSHPRFILRLKGLQQAIVSARKKVYNHPHPITQKTFLKNKIPLITTEHFGTLIYEWDNSFKSKKARE